MRSTSTYRHARRNSLRATEPRSRLRHWGLGGAAVIANNTAKLPERAKQCADANVAVRVALVKEASTSTGTLRIVLIHRALRDFWSVIPKRTAVIARILRELRDKPSNKFDTVIVSR